MKISTYSSLLSTLCLFFFIPLVSAQIQEVSRISMSQSYDFAFFNFDDRILVFSEDDIDHSIWEIDLLGEEPSLMLSGLSNVQSISRNSNGIFFVTLSYRQNGNDEKHSLHYISQKGDTTNCGLLTLYTASDKYRSRYTAVSNDRFYVTGYMDGTNNVWESDGTKQGSKIIYRSEQSIINLESLGEDLIIITQSEDAFNLINYSQADSLVPIKSFSRSQYSPSRKSPFKSIGKDASHLYFNLNENSGKQMIWRTDGTASNTHIFLEDHNSSAISFKEDKFEIEKGWTGNYTYLTGFTSMPEVLDTLGFSATYRTPSQTVSSRLGDSVYLCGSNEYGLELGYKNEQDSLTLFKDFAKGSRSSVACFLPYYGYACYKAENFLVENSQSLYAILSNGNDPHFYLYHVSDAGFKSLFRVRNPELLKRSFLFNQHLYWFEFVDQAWSLKKYALNQASLEEQPLEAISNKETWLRQISAARTSYFTTSSANYGIQLSTRGVYLNDEGEVFVGAWARNGQVMLNSHTATPTPKRGSFAITKYNPFGEVLWQKSVGNNFGGTGYYDHFALDNEGNLVVVGTYFKKAFFGQDSLTSPNAGHYMAKLSGETGEILWKKKLSETFYTNDIEVELTLTFDQENNIYTSFLYRRFKVSYAGVHLTAEKSAINAMASFDPEGNSRWVKNIETPWLDAYGKTRILTFNKQSNTLLAAQSQGYFNVLSSCGYSEYDYFFQEIDLNGNVVDTFSFKGSDIGALVTGAYMDNGRFMGLGFHRGTLNLGPSATESTRESEECHETEGFVFEFAKNKLDVIFANTFSSPTLIPTDIKVYQDHVYIYGTRNNRLVLLKYATNGAFIGYKLINQRARVFDFGFFNFLDVKDGYIVLVGDKFRADSLNQINPLLAMEENIAILKISDDNWIEDEESFDQISASLKEPEAPLLAYPNPFDRFIRIATPPDGTTYDRYELFNISGNLIQKGELVDTDNYEFDFNQLNPGMYLLSLSSQDSRTTIKIIKK